MHFRVPGPRTRSLCFLRSTAGDTVAKLVGVVETSTCESARAALRTVFASVVRGAEIVVERLNNCIAHFKRVSRLCEGVGTD